MAARKIFAVYDGGKEEGEFTSREIADHWGNRQETVTACADTGKLYKGRYLFETVDEVIRKTRSEPLWKKWDAARLKILEAGR
ncbi:hypothetical protein [Clostridium sp. HBUAS56010]|uniref:hypothetical protein n=1 Tax=Clostridium sp. HBUAS56010 TaxID=2571127 RepID=UPI001177B911|nr:hypothetical protein [Clostridium sp. HBUAS56010]